MANIIVDTMDLVRELIKHIEDAVQKPFIFVDLESVDLSRDGVVAIMQILVPPNPVVHLVDVHKLQHQAFNTTGPGGHTLKQILESKDHLKVFFDVRNDSDALYSHFQIGLHGVVDLQLLEFATRPRRSRFLNGLAKCISEDADLRMGESQEWQRTKQDGKGLFAPERVGRYEVFLERPLSSTLRKYCAQDVLVMPKLLAKYGRHLTPDLAMQINAEVLARVALSQSSNFNGKGRHMAVGPSFNWYGIAGRIPDEPGVLQSAGRSLLVGHSGGAHSYSIAAVDGVASDLRSHRVT